MTPEEILAPGGNPIGAPSGGGDETIRDMPGGAEGAEEIYDRLSQDRGDYPGRAVLLSGGGFVGIRTADSAHPTIDVNIPGIPKVAKLHF